MKRSEPETVDETDLMQPPTKKSKTTPSASDEPQPSIPDAGVEAMASIPDAGGEAMASIPDAGREAMETSPENGSAPVDEIDKGITGGYSIHTNPAKKWPFELDPFQTEAIEVLERGENVLVAAHTSAGKTVVAEYAIALALKMNQRVIYTSPIKALSNQKFRDFQDTFAEYPGEIGLMTGDVTKNPNASCLVMTTEIMRNFLYKGHELIREVKYVIFDEVHYMKDKERGVIWEESIILLNPRIQIIFLSATISNRDQFAAWVMHVKNGRPCIVVSTDKRPVPLEHYVYPADSDGVFLVRDKNGKFHGQNFDMSRRAFEIGQHKHMMNQKLSKQGYTKMWRLIQFLKKNSHLPAIVFSFRRREVEHRASCLAKIYLNNQEEMDAVEEVFTNAIALLNEEDRNLASIKSLLPMLMRGIGIHHSGLLPILKEIVEILFCEGLLKVLFATETFAMGVNMPAKVVVFTCLEKYDGIENRLLTSSEYTQMAGRAGRRGIDDRGICILMSSLEVKREDLEKMIGTEAQNELTSSFRLSYNMLLNLKRVDFATSRQMIDKSFFSWVLNTELPNRKSTLETLEKECNVFKERSDFKLMQEYFDLRDSKMELFREKVQQWVTRPEVAIRFLQTGRLIRVEVKGVDWGWGVVLFAKRRYADDPEHLNRPRFFIDVLMKINEVERSGNLMLPHQWAAEEKEERLAEHKENKDENRRLCDTGIVRISSECLAEIGTPIMRLPPDLTDPFFQKCVFDEIEKCKNTDWRGSVPTIAPFELPLHLAAKPEEIKEASEQMKSLETRIKAHAFHYQNEKYKNEQHDSYKEWKKKHNKIAPLKDWIEQQSTGLFSIELDQKSKVLRRLGFIDDNDTLTEKGLFGCCIESVDELVMTELLFEGIFNKLSAPESIALLAAFLPHGKCKTKQQLTPSLKEAYQQLQAKARTLWNFQKEYRVMKVDEKNYLFQFEATLVPIILAWAKGKSFQECAAMTDAFEGNIVRMLRRIEELLRQLVDAVKAIGNEPLVEKFGQGETLIKRGIAFAASLYIEDEDDEDEEQSGEEEEAEDDGAVEEGMEEAG